MMEDSAEPTRTKGHADQRPPILQQQEERRTEQREPQRRDHRRVLDVMHERQREHVTVAPVVDLIPVVVVVCVAGGAAAINGSTRSVHVCCSCSCDR